MKKRYIAISAAIIAIIVLALGSAAYLSKSGITESTVRSSNLKIELVMMEYKDDVPTEAEGTVEIMPGDYVHRMATVKNGGKEPAWVRIKIADQEKLELIELNEANWREDDGYWYYRSKLDPGKTTEPLFYGIRVREEAGNEDAGKSITLDIDAEGVQTKHNGSTALEVKGWPEA